MLVPHVVAQESAVQTAPEQAAERCTLAQNYLVNNQKQRDLRARVDRLQAYRYIYQRMDIFTRRLERNNQPDAINFRSTLNKFQINMDSFKNNYEKYDAAREQLVQIKDCRSNTSVFLAQLEDVRAKRLALSKDIVAIETVLSPTLKSQLETLYQTLLSTGKSGARGE